MTRENLFPTVSKGIREVFSELYVNMVQSGEISGNLQKSLEDLADNIEKNYTLTQKIKGSALLSGFYFGRFFHRGVSDAHFCHSETDEMLKETNANLPDHDQNSDWSGRFYAAMVVGGAIWRFSRAMRR